MRYPIEYLRKAKKKVHLSDSSRIHLSLDFLCERQKLHLKISPYGTRTDIGKRSDQIRGDLWCVKTRCVQEVWYDATYRNGLVVYGRKVAITHVYRKELSNFSV